MEVWLIIDHFSNDDAYDYPYYGDNFVGIFTSFDDAYKNAKELIRRLSDDGILDEEFETASENKALVWRETREYYGVFEHEYEIRKALMNELDSRYKEV